MSMKTISELFKFRDWLRDEVGLAESSVSVYFYSLRRYLQYCKGDPLDIENLNWFIAEFSHKSRSRYHYFVLKKYIRFKTQNNVKLREDIYDKLLKGKLYKDIKRERRYLTDDKLVDIIHSIDDNVFQKIAMLQMLTAARIGGILSVKREGVSIEAYEDKEVMRIVTLEKRSKRRIAYLFDPIAIDAMQQYLQWYDARKSEFYEDYIFIRIAKNGRMGNVNSYNDMKHMTYVQYWRELKKAIQACGVVDKKLFATHDFRRCFARKAWEKYKDVNALQRLLDHEHPSTTLGYLKQSGLQNIDLFKELQND